MHAALIVVRAQRLAMPAELAASSQDQSALWRFPVQGRPRLGRVQVHYKGLRVLLAWRDAQGGCFEPLHLPSYISPLEAGLASNSSLALNLAL